MNGDQIIHLSELSNNGKYAMSEFCFKSVSFHYLRVFFNVGYWLLLVPFRYIERDRKYYLHVNKIQRVGFLAIMICTAILGLSSFRLFSLVKIKEKPGFLFSFSLIAANVGFCFVAAYIFWFKTKSAETILEICQDDYRSTSRNKKHSFVAFLFCLLSIAIAFWLIYKPIILGTSTQWLQIKERVLIYQFTFFLKNNLTIVTDDDMTPLVTGVAIFSLIVDLYWRLVICFVVLFCFMSAIMVKVLSDEFNKFLNEIGEEGQPSIATLEKVSYRFRKIVDLLSAMNSMSGPILIVFVLEAVPYFAIKVIEFFETNDMVAKIEILVFFGYYFLILFTAAAGHSKIDIFKSWLFLWSRPVENKNFRLKLMSLSMEASNEHLGLDGGGFFFVTYEFVGAMTSLFITYAIIMIQF